MTKAVTKKKSASSAGDYSGLVGGISKLPDAVEHFQTPSGKSAPFSRSDLARAFPRPWSHYVLLISRSRSPEAFAFHHTAHPDEKTLAAELEKPRKQLEAR
jgi:hypothetical protein